ncbi:hypothetical protein RIF29_13380 [Crotalaria pallida]|uniref:Uncharacterized protein n=1 Tax=Crotalaria pallida TaxID=3830 RepID=A0AAN9IPD2_CROPI
MFGIASQGRRHAFEEASPVERGFQPHIQTRSKCIFGVAFVALQTIAVCNASKHALNAYLLISNFIQLLFLISILTLSLIFQKSTTQPLSGGLPPQCWCRERPPTTITVFSNPKSPWPPPPQISIQPLILNFNFVPIPNLSKTSTIPPPEPKSGPPP